MKNLVVLSITILLVVLSCGGAFAATYKHSDAKFELSVPDTWKVSNEDGNFRIEAQGDTAADNIVMDFEAVEAEDLSATMEEGMKWISKEMVEMFGEEKGVLKESGEMSEIKIGGMDAINQLFTCNDGKYAVDITIFITPSKKFMALYYYATVEAEKKHEKEISDIIKSIKPIEDAGFEKK
ncbi:MAG: hypothetical protein A2008_02195 [Candidatus Wallbacteria bacterium GWC2_49_35]|uniref:PsbP C-terminal domain-containing protein n=1 Tax=Candidatus Wallbacteria bacterium GWC2_49_35 TaxID=1817813 RepID=A0A1F7WV31_9BACT|nr:MAG: hypothetical protein A2008_02195 [Candidatus Wallbacteria bacterium GWC2_49_35]